MSQQGFWWYLLRQNRHGPDLLAATRTRGAGVTDVFVLFSDDLGCAYRAPEAPGQEVLAPRSVLWVWSGPLAQAGQMLLKLPAPDDPAAPRVRIEAPPLLAELGQVRPARIFPGTHTT